MVSKGKKELMIFQKRILGLLGFFLAPCAIGFGLLGDNSAIIDPKWWYSISMTYYANSQICMIGVLFSMAVMFLSYIGYNTSDKVLTIISGISAMGIIVFPCGHEGIEITGLLGLECGTSFIIHCTFASLMFISFAIMVGYNFTQTKGGDNMTPEKQLRNKIYYTCAGIIGVFMLNQVIASIFGFPGYWTLINEAIMLWAFSFAWLVKAEFFECFNDKKASPELNNVIKNEIA
ncbi:MAG: hypothetical protein J6T70_12300 [Bacteroidales bacterium]|nr:hypothetical protein [Bacteroidales bacterium]